MQVNKQNIQFSAKSLKLLNQFIQNAKINNRSEHTLKNYRSDLQFFLTWYEYYHTKYILRCKPMHISSYLAFLSGEVTVKIEHSWLEKFTRWLGPKTNSPPTPRVLAINSKKRHLSAIFNFFEFLMEYSPDYAKKLGANPVKKKLHRIKVKDADIKHTKLITLDQFLHLLTFVPKNKDRLIFYIMYYGGLRLSELCHLTYESISIKNKTLSFYRKGGYYHELKLHWDKELLPLLMEQVRFNKKNGGHIFGGAKSPSERGMYAKIMNYIQKASLDTYGITPHSFRKGCASLLYKETKDLLYVRDYLNHKDAQVTQTYIERI